MVTLISPHLPHLAKGFLFMEHSRKGCPSWSLVPWVGVQAGLRNPAFLATHPPSPPRPRKALSPGEG